MEEVNFSHSHSSNFSRALHGPMARVHSILMEEVTHGRVEVGVEGSQVML